LMVFQNQFQHMHHVHMFLICWNESCILHDWCQPTLELSARSPYKNVVSIHQTTALNGSEFQGWKFFCLYKLSHHKVSTIITTTHKLIT
jgi:hypothetical protein